MNAIQFDMVIVGVGGQGTLLASKIIGHMALEKNLKVKVSEVHGMAQRGGSVITHVRIGNHVHAPLVAEGTADYVVAFEELEAARSAEFLKKDGVMVVNTQQIWPMPVVSGAAEYPSNPLEKVMQSCQVVQVNALEKAIEAGNARVVNIVLLGALAKHLSFTKADWIEAITASVKPSTLEVNLKAFAMGYAR